MNKKQVLSLILSLLMLVPLALPIGAFAEEIYEEPVYEEFLYEEPVYEDLLSEEDDFANPTEYTESFEDFIDTEDTFEIIEFEPQEAVEDNYTAEFVLVDDDIAVYEAESPEEEIDFLHEDQLYEAAGLAITTQPKSYSGAEGSNATFTVAASGSGLTYQWQYKLANSTTWTDSPAASAKTASLTVEATTARNGNQYRCIVKDGSGNSVTSEAATLTVSTLTITSQPKSYSGAEGSNATFTVAASGSGLTYQWQYKLANSTTWTDSPAASAKTASLTVEATTARNGNQYRCIVKDSSGNSVTSEVATLTISTIVSGDFVFKKIEGTNNLTLIEYKGSASNIEVPGRVDGMTVTEIGVSPLGDGEKGVFEGNTTLTSIKLPNTITAIREKSFKGCTNLSTMTTY